MSLTRRWEDPQDITFAATIDENAGAQPLPVTPEERARRIEAAIAKLRPAMRAAFVAEG